MLAPAPEAQAHALLVAMLRGEPTRLSWRAFEVLQARRRSHGFQSHRPQQAGNQAPRRGDRGRHRRRVHSGSRLRQRCPGVRVPVPRRLRRHGPSRNTSRFGEIATVFTDKRRDAEGDRDLCRRSGAEPHIHERRQPGSGVGKHRWSVGHSDARGLGSRRLALRYDRPGLIVQSLLQAASCSWLQTGSLASSASRPQGNGIRTVRKICCTLPKLSI